MPASHRLMCRCGALQGQVASNGVSNHVVCHCKDCQAFARFLGQADSVLDRQGGTDIVQLAAEQVQITQGREQLAVMRLSPKGLLRWYAQCCNTPIGNTLPNPRMGFVGLVHACLKSDPIETTFGPVRTSAFGASALGEPKPRDHGLAGLVAKVAWLAARAHVTGSYKRSPFLGSNGQPVAVPTLVSAAQRQRLSQPAQDPVARV